jgi:hypothetical protein
MSSLSVFLTNPELLPQAAAALALVTWAVVVVARTLWPVSPPVTVDGVIPPVRRLERSANPRRMRGRRDHRGCARPRPFRRSAMSCSMRAEATARSARRTWS